MASRSERQKRSASGKKSSPQIVKTTYTSKEVAIPHDFLTTTRSDAEPTTVQRIDFKSSPIPEYDGCYATVLENVLSPSECAQLLRLAEASSPTGGWAPALLNVGPGYEMLAKDVRFHDRIIWDNEEIVKRIWDRCLKADGIADELSIHEETWGRGSNAGSMKWRMTKVNERMRFLRYGPGHYFKSHCDGAYETPDGSQRTFYTIQLYLNDSLASGGDLKGGATSFHAPRNEERRINVNPRMGRVLIFQHAKLLHSGDEVTQGIKYTMRSDLLYEEVEE
ncbi:hypothetical protein HWV62_14810 [Athelia sp. TMB]|nr:hypothetical protein HWV62_14810 [Athelia sp. TMB]